MMSSLLRYNVALLFVYIYWSTLSSSSANTISYLRFEEGSGYTTADETGLMDGELLGFDGLIGAGWSSDVPNSTIPLTGQANNYSMRLGGYVDLSNANDVNLGTTFTIEYFFCLEDIAGGAARAFVLTPGSTLTSLIAENPETHDLFYGINLQGTTHLIPAAGLLFNTWQHMAIVKSPGDFQLYLDGSLVSQQSVPSSEDGPFFFPGTAMTGDRKIGGNGLWHGWLDEFRISDTALTPDQFLCAIPEPATLALLIVGLPALGFARHRNRVRKE